MTERILGIDTGTNSIGWAIVDYDPEATESAYTLIDQGVHIFQEGVKIDKGIESSKAADRTLHKQIRVHYWRRKVRKIQLLKLLIAYRLCPPLSREELRNWRSKKQYPMNEDFLAWQRTDEETHQNPYYDRNLCLTQKLDLTDPINRYRVGRALYHINQRRGFLSNRKEDTQQSDGVVSHDIDALSQEMEANGAEYLGQYFYSLYQKGEKIRTRYTSRKDHYEKELLAICRKQELSEECTEALRKVILTQRPLKSQKHTVGHCVFEPAKTRCPSSHPLYEQFRMYSFLNNIKVKGPQDEDLRPLTDAEKAAVIPKFLRKSKKEFKFEDIAKTIANGKKNYGHYKDPQEFAYRFNYHMDTLVSGCPVIAQLAEAFDATNGVDEWLEAACEVYTQGVRKNRYDIMNDIWHVLTFFDDEAKLQTFASEKLQMDAEHARLFSQIRVPSDYVSLSLKAIRKILPYMKQYGMLYSHAVLLANIPQVISCPTDSEALLPMLPRDEADDIVRAFYDYDPKMTAITQEAYVKQYICYKYRLSADQEQKLKKLYHPSRIETFLKVHRGSYHEPYQLGSPRTSSMRNPMAMRSLFRLRHVINALLKKGIIDENTVVRIEFARELNDANKRAALKRWQDQHNRDHKKYAEKIKEHLGKDYDPSTVDLLKYQLWEEQSHICLYTGKTIQLADLFNPNSFDLEHTVPRSVGGDSTAMNLTLCDSRYNRDIKKAQMPSQLAQHEEILERIAHWKLHIAKLEKDLRRIHTRGVSDKGVKDGLIQKRHLLMLERDYWKGKYNRFTMTEVPEGFSRRQGVDISVISKYARLYLKSLFRHVYIVKGIVTADFRKIWGLQEEYDKKQRVNHCHHAIDAVTIACIGRAEYDKLARYYHNEELFEWGMDSKRATFPKPWSTFTEDVKQLSDSLLVSHYTADNAGKRTRKKIRVNGKCTGQYMEGDTARLSLHKESYYGAIERDGEIVYVIRKPLTDDIKIDQIVDEAVREKVREAKEKYGSIKKAMEVGIWMNEEKGIRIHKVRIATGIKRPLKIRAQRDASRKEYKRHYFVTNDTNYMMGIYVGPTARGKEKRDFVLINSLDAVQYHNSGVAQQGLSMLPEKSENGYPLKWQVKVGTLVLLYEESPEELYNLDKKGLSRRIYKVAGLSSSMMGKYIYGSLSLYHHQEARPTSDLTLKNGAYKANEVLRPGIAMLHTQFNGLVQGIDFKLDELGNIVFKKE